MPALFGALGRGHQSCTGFFFCWRPDEGTTNQRKITRNSQAGGVNATLKLGGDGINASRQPTGHCLKYPKRHYGLPAFGLPSRAGRMAGRGLEGGAAVWAGGKPAQAPPSRPGKSPPGQTAPALRTVADCPGEAAAPSFEEVRLQDDFVPWDLADAEGMELFPEGGVHELRKFDGGLPRERLHAGGIDVGKRKVELVLAG